MAKEIAETQAWDIIKPVCRELYELVNEKNGYVCFSYRE